MKTRIYLGLVICGAIPLVLSAFLPPGSMHSPFGMFQWTSEAVSTSDTPAEAAAFVAIAMVLTYPYFWAALTAFLCAASLLRGWTARAWPHLTTHTLGNLTLIALSVALLALRDPWLPRKAQLAGATVPPLILLAMWLVARLKPAPRGAWAVTTLGFLLQTLIQFGAAAVSVHRCGKAWGFAVGGIGAAIALLASLALTIQQRHDKT